MPQHKSSAKRVRQDAKKRVHNKNLRSNMRGLVKDVLNSTKKTEAEKTLKAAVASLDRGVTKGLLHKNNAANKKSRLVKHVNKLG